MLKCQNYVGLSKLQLSLCLIVMNEIQDIQLSQMRDKESLPSFKI